MTVPLRTCCLVFNLRQGTMLIAVVELLLSAICLFLLLLGSAHAQDMAAMLEADIEESQQREGIYMDNADSTGMIPIQYSNNETRLHTAQHLALVMIIFLYTGIAMVTIHLVSCVLLLYGAIMQIRQFVLPWVSVVVIALVVSFTGLLVCMILGYGTQSILIIVSFVIQMRFCLWLVVFSFYRQLYEVQVASCAALAQQDMTSIKAGYMNFPHNKPSDV